MRVRNTLWAVFAVVFFMVTTSVAQQTNNKQIKKVPIKPTSAASGQEMYNTYCAVCHGVDGKGHGPAADALKVPPTDLTLLAQKNGGKYPAIEVAAIIRGKNTIAAHGTEEMPVWGHLFWSVSGGSQAEVQQRISNLNKYIESLQKKD